MNQEGAIASGRSRNPLGGEEGILLPMSQSVSDPVSSTGVVLPCRWLRSQHNTCIYSKYLSQSLPLFEFDHPFHSQSNVRTWPICVAPRANSDQSDYIHRGSVFVFEAQHRRPLSLRECECSTRRAAEPRQRDSYILSNTVSTLLLPIKASIRILAT